MQDTEKQWLDAFVESGQSLLQLWFDPGLTPKEMLGILGRMLKLCKNIHEEAEFIESWEILVVRTKDG